MVDLKQKGSDVISAIQALKIASEHLGSFVRDRPNTALARPFKLYLQKIEWMFKDLKSNNLLPDNVREGIRAELESDIFIIPALNEKIALLPLEYRETLENIIDKLLSGHTINVTDKNKAGDNTDNTDSNNS